MLDFKVGLVLTQGYIAALNHAMLDFFSTSELIKINTQKNLPH